jgi:hypothetical protein
MFGVRRHDAALERSGTTLPYKNRADVSAHSKINVVPLHSK